MRGSYFLRFFCRLRRHALVLVVFLPPRTGLTGLTNHRHFQERLVFLGIAAPLAALLAGNDAERLQAAQRLLSLTAPFARRKFARYSLDKPDDPPQAEDYDPWPEVMAELAAMNEEAGAAPPIAADAPT